MGRIRTIKPELFTHWELFQAEKESGLPLRVAFPGLWTVADRLGRFRWIPPQLKLACLPYDDLDFSEVLDALQVCGLIHRYTVEESDFGCIPTWNKHQVINTRERQSELPSPEDGVMVKAPPSRHIPSETRRQVLAHALHGCAQCGAKDNLQIDHIIPFSKGGTHSLDNLQILCASCNSIKGDRCLAHPIETHMPSTVRAQGEGKGREVEGKGREGELLVPPAGNDTPEAPTPPPPKTEKQKAEESFEAFWAESTKRGSKKKALSSWQSMTNIPKKDLPTEHKVETYAELFDKAFNRMQVWKVSDDWTKEDGKYCPHVTTWLNRQGWNEIHQGEAKQAEIQSNPAFRTSKNEIVLKEDD